MYLFDLENFFTGDKFSYHFNPSGFYNGKNSWLSDDSTVKIIWDTTLNAWKLSGDTLGTTQVINTNPNYPPINGNWTVLGQSYSVAANQGLCTSVNALKFTYNYNNPGCVCDGSINISASGGVPPYQYSFNNGVTYLSSPIITGLCGGIFNMIVKDSEGTTVTNSVTLNNVETPVSYNANLNLSSSQPITSTSTEYTFQVNINPPLPVGEQVTFDLNLLGSFGRTPYSGSATSTFSPQVIKNGVTIVGTQNTTETTTQNTVAGCQGYLRYLTNYSYVYPALTMVSTDVYTIKIITDYTLDCEFLPFNYFGNYALDGNNNQSPIGPLSYGVKAAAYQNCCNCGFDIPVGNSFISNVSISGCHCCSILVTRGLYE